MWLRAIVVAAVCITASAASTRAADAPPVIDARGVIHYTASRVKWLVHCGRHPIMLQGDHTSMDLRGRCWRVTLTGSHNDVSVQMAHGGWFIITGSHNDVTWRQIERGRPPAMVDRGERNTFHPAVPQGRWR